MNAAEFTAATDTAGEQAALVKELEALQNRLALKLSTLLGQLETDGGTITASASNIAKIDQIVRLLKEGFADERWTKAVAKYLGAFDGIEGALKDYMAAFGPLPDDLLTAIKRQFKASTAAYLTTADSFAAELWNPLSNQLLGSVATGQDLSSAIDGAQTAVVGAPDAKGALVAAVEGPVATATTAFQRSATQSASDAVGSEFFKYQGRSIDTTRAFCKARAGKFFHRKEIEEWGRRAASGDGWEGMFEGTNETNIFVHLGGYYGKRSACRHVLVPVPRRDVPSEDLDRMRDKGLIE